MEESVVGKRTGGFSAPAARAAVGLGALLVLACAAMLACALTLALPASAGAAETGSISLTMRTTDGKAVSGGELDLYQVATYQGGSYVYTAAFSSCDKGVTQGRLSDKSYINELVGLAKSATATTTATIPEGGKVTFANLSRGLYLVVQGKAASGYESCNPFLVTIPSLENGSYVYDVNATPKVGPVTPVNPDNPDKPDNPDNPDKPDNPDNPDTPVDPDEPSNPDEPDNPGGGGSTTKARLPQTGQLWWPVWVLGAGGAVLVVAGIVRKRRA